MDNHDCDFDETCDGNGMLRCIYCDSEVKCAGCSNCLD